MTAHAPSAPADMLNYGTVPTRRPGGVAAAEAGPQTITVHPAKANRAVLMVPIDAAHRLPLALTAKIRQS